MSNLRRFENPTEGTAPTPERLLPTRPGAWWGRWCDPGEPVEWTVFHVFADMGSLKIIWEGEIWSVGSLEWLAEVPPPDVSAAWAAAGRPSAAVLEALGEWAERVFSWEDAGGRQAGAGGHSGRFAALSDAILDAEESLLDGIRAERAAQGSAQVGGEA